VGWQGLPQQRPGVGIQSAKFLLRLDSANGVVGFEVVGFEVGVRVKGLDVGGSVKVM
jgi:hypothetical protein